MKLKQKSDYDSRHGTRPLADIPDDTKVWVTTRGAQSPGQVTAHANTPRSYLVDTPTGTIRRNRAHLTVMQSSDRTGPADTQDRSPIMTRSRTGTRIIPPERL